MIVGLGNPGPNYAGTRHNVGFEVVEELARRHRLPLNRSKHSGLCGSGAIEGTPVVLLKPLTYMNLSGRSVVAHARDHELAPDRILVVADDLDLPTGKVRMRPKGSAGGHNGHKSVIEKLGTTEYPRLRIGIGCEGPAIDHVLSRFDPEERPLIRDAVARAADSVEVLLRDGLEKAISFANG
ncbi:MAG: aminoacyl-tRNA hydrolase [Fimbriimonadaceae bacterium]|nr:aminoacyl-tRNA hydrolase [Fimbriimonadaceae bacterium]